MTLDMIREGTASFQLDTATTSDEIRAVQKVLYMYGYCPGGAPDGKYGAGTQAAVRGFQNENSLNVNNTLHQIIMLTKG